jgi:homoserine dehydrogenase
MGLGTVGKAVAASLVDPAWRRWVEDRGMMPPELVAVGVRDPERPRGITLPDGIRRTDALLDLAASPDVDVVVELIGGTTVAMELIEAAIGAGRSVVTANKALLSRCGAQLEAVTRRQGVALRFEAAVAGGVPVLGPLVKDLAADRIEAVRGIVNGTTNHILSAMATDRRSYEDVLGEAQERGYAEADPRGDVEGGDAADKLAILTRLAFGRWPAVDRLRRAVPATRGDAPAGITGVKTWELERAAELGLTIKLIARAEPGPDGGVRAAVTPVAVRATSPLGATSGVTNLVEVAALPVGRVSFRGPGAGGPATASAVLGDLLAIVRGEGSTWGVLPEAPATTDVRDDLDGERAWFFVLRELAGSHIPGSITELALAGSEDAYVTRAVPLELIRQRLAALDLHVSLYPVIAEA